MPEALARALTVLCDDKVKVKTKQLRAVIQGYNLPGLSLSAKSLRNLRFRIATRAHTDAHVPSLDDLLADLQQTELSTFFKYVHKSLAGHEALNQVVAALAELQESDSSFHYRVMKGRGEGREHILEGAVWVTSFNRAMARDFGSVLFYDPLANVSKERYKGIMLDVVTNDQHIAPVAYGFTVGETQDFAHFFLSSAFDMSPELLARNETIFLDRGADARQIEDYIAQRHAGKRVRVYYDQWHIKTQDLPTHLQEVQTGDRQEVKERFKCLIASHTESEYDTRRDEFRLAYRSYTGLMTWFEDSIVAERSAIVDAFKDTFTAGYGGSALAESGNCSWRAWIPRGSVIVGIVHSTLEYDNERATTERQRRDDLSCGLDQVSVDSDAQQAAAHFSRKACVLFHHELTRSSSYKATQEHLSYDDDSEGDTQWVVTSSDPTRDGKAVTVLLYGLCGTSYCERDGHRRGIPCCHVVTARRTAGQAVFDRKDFHLHWGLRTDSDWFNLRPSPPTAAGGDGDDDLGDGRGGDLHAGLGDDFGSESEMSGVDDDPDATNSGAPPLQGHEGLASGANPRSKRTRQARYNALHTKAKLVVSAAAANNNLCNIVEAMLTRFHDLIRGERVDWSGVTKLIDTMTRRVPRPQVHARTSAVTAPDTAADPTTSTAPALSAAAAAVASQFSNANALPGAGQDESRRFASSVHSRSAHGRTTSRPTCSVCHQEGHRRNACDRVDALGQQLGARDLRMGDLRLLAREGVAGGGENALSVNWAALGRYLRGRAKGAKVVRVDGYIAEISTADAARATDDDRSTHKWVPQPVRNQLTDETVIGITWWGALDLLDRSATPPQGYMLVRDFNT